MGWSGLPRRRKQRKGNKRKPKNGGVSFLAVITNIKNISFKLAKALRNIVWNIPLYIMNSGIVEIVEY